MFTILGGDIMYKNIGFFKFQKMFSTEKKCWNYLVRKHWPNGYQCPRCGHNKYYFHKKRQLFECKACRYQASVTANTIFHKTRTPLYKWFWAIYLVVNHKKGISTLQLMKTLDIGSYKTAWLMTHKIRKAMASREASYRLGGLMEIDDTYFGGKKHPGKRGRGSENKAPVLAAVEVPDNQKPRFAFLQVVKDLTAKEVENCLTRKVHQLSILKTDAHKSFFALPEKGYYHYPKVMNNTEKIQKHLPWVHTVIANAKNAIRATFHGVSAKHLRRMPPFGKRYLDEFNFRFNRRFWEPQLFDRLLNACLITNTITFSELRE